ncbi:MAG: M28 family peptidase, partial [Patescibacteria group bacterium]|nr:M28 family peptidase [Patescibacteria group bacterium]
IAWVTRVKDRPLLRQCISAFRKHAAFPSEGGAVPDVLPGTAWSDHWSFWQFDYPAVMLTDTLPFRNPHYHEPTDTADRLDYNRTARVADGLLAVIRDLAGQQ